MGRAMGDETEGLFRDLVEAFPDAVVISRAFRTVFVNPEAVRLFGGASPDEILGRPVPGLFHADDREAVTAAIDRALGGERVLRADARVVALDGGVRYVEISTTVPGDPASVALIIRDV